MKFKHVLLLLLALVVLFSFLFPLVIYPYYQRKRRAELLRTIPDRIVAGMTLEQKVGQLLHVGMNGKTLNMGIRREIEERRVGGVILFAKNLGSKREIQALTRDLQRLSVQSNGIPIFISTDQEGGRVHRVPADAAEQFPGAMALGQTGRPELAREVGLVTGHELNRLGINLVLAPVLDVNNNPENPVIHTRSFGCDAGLVATMGAALARGIREANSTPVIKHFPGHGDTRIDSHLALPRIAKSVHEMERLELAPFRRAIREGAEVVMSAHILYKSLDTEYPATLSRAILTGLLRERLAFRGLVMTDAMEMHAISRRYSHERAAKLAFQAGADVILLTAPGNTARRMYRALLEGFRSGELSRERLDAAVRRQIALKLRRGLFQTHGAVHSGQEELKEHFREIFARAEQRYIAILKKYSARGVSLNALVSRESVSALRRPFAGLSRERRKSVRLFYRSNELRNAAVRLGVPPNRIHRIGGPGALRSRPRRRPADETWLVEIRERDRHAWNRLVRRIDARAKKGAPTIALYAGNPFLSLRVPRRGAILASFSPTTESVRALAYRALDGRPVRRAVLILREMKD